MCKAANIAEKKTYILQKAFEISRWILFSNIYQWVYDRVTAGQLLHLPDSLF